MLINILIINIFTLTGATNTSKSINALKNNSLRISNNKDYTANQSESCHRRLSSKFENADLDKSILVEETAVKEPEAAPEPIGPDQNLPVSSEPQIAPPSERKATSYINVSSYVILVLNYELLIKII